DDDVWGRDQETGFLFQYVFLWFLTYYWRTRMGGSMRRKWLNGIARQGNCSAISRTESLLSLISAS
ncbi:hypothetical protein CH063_10397, partial [Colletotrichum higginsianum]